MYTVYCILYIYFQLIYCKQALQKYFAAQTCETSENQRMVVNRHVQACTYVCHKSLAYPSRIDFDTDLLWAVLRFSL